MINFVKVCIEWLDIRIIAPTFFIYYPLLKTILCEYKRFVNNL